MKWAINLIMIIVILTEWLSSMGRYDRLWCELSMIELDGRSMRWHGGMLYTMAAIIVVSAYKIIDVVYSTGQNSKHTSTVGSLVINWLVLYCPFDIKRRDNRH